MLKVFFDRKYGDFNLDRTENHLLEVDVFFVGDKVTLIGGVLFVFGHLVHDAKTDVRHVVCAFFDGDDKLFVFVFGSVGFFQEFVDLELGRDSVNHCLRFFSK